MEPLTIDQLQSLGFHIFYRNKRGQQVFDCATYLDWKIDDLVGELHELPTFEKLVKIIADKATEKEKRRISEKLAEQAKQMLD